MFFPTNSSLLSRYLTTRYKSGKVKKPEKKRLITRKLRLRDLPDNVIDQILSSLPIADAVQTSLLSNQWRNRWKSVSGLSFKLSKCPQHEHIVDKVLRLHSGRIQKFHVNCCRYFIPAKKVIEWVHYLSDHPIEDLVIDIPTSDDKPWEMPSSALLSWKNLTCLKLTKCLLTLPSTSRAFKCLKSLEIREYRLTDDCVSLESLISGAPALETLCLDIEKAPIGVGFNVDSPSLKSFKFSCNQFIAIRLINCLALKEFSFDVDEDSLGSVCGSYNLANLLGWSPRLQTLNITGVSLEYLASGVMPIEFPSQFKDLRSLSIKANLRSANHVTAIYLLLRSAPNLQKLVIQPWPIFRKINDMGGNHRQEVEQCDVSFPCLKNVSVEEFSASKEEIRFVELMVSSSPILCEVYLSVSPRTDMGFTEKFALMRHFMRLEHRCPNAIVLVTS